MRSWTVLSALLTTSALLAGCSGGQSSGSDGSDDDLVTDPNQLATGKGAISGLLIDDRYRPLANGLVLLQPVGMTATTNDNGEFQFVNLDPGQYTARATIEGHEAAPQRVQVVAGNFVDLNLEARRIFSTGSRIVTSEYSVFIPCAIDYVANGNVIDCTGDTSGDSFRAAFTSNYTEYQNVTYLVTEMKASKEDRFEVQVRSGCEGYLAVSQFAGVYTKMIMPMNGTSETHAEASYGPNQVWDNGCDIDTILFSDSQFREEAQQVAPVCCGAGVHFGIRATFIQSLFLGAPEVDINDYHVMSE